MPGINSTDHIAVFAALLSYEEYPFGVVTYDQARKLRRLSDEDANGFRHALAEEYGEEQLATAEAEVRENDRLWKTGSAAEITAHMRRQYGNMMPSEWHAHLEASQPEHPLDEGDPILAFGPSFRHYRKLETTAGAIGTCPW